MIFLFHGVIFRFLSSTENIHQAGGADSLNLLLHRKGKRISACPNLAQGSSIVDPKHQNSQPQILCVKLANIWNYSSGVQFSCNMMLHFVVSTLNSLRST